MYRKRESQQFTREIPKVSSTFQKIVLAGWGATARLAMLLLIKQGAADVLILLILRRR